MTVRMHALDGTQGLATRLVATNGKIPQEDSFAKAAEHVLKLTSDMRVAVFAARCALSWE